MDSTSTSLVVIMLVDELFKVRKLSSYPRPASNHKDALIIFDRYNETVLRNEHVPRRARRLDGRDGEAARHVERRDCEHRRLAKRDGETARRLEGRGWRDRNYITDLDPLGIRSCSLSLSFAVLRFLWPLSSQVKASRWNNMT